MIQSVVLQSSSDNPHLAGKTIHNDGAIQLSPALTAWAVQRSRAGLSNAKGFLLRVGHDLNNNPIRKFHCALAFLNEIVKLEQTSAWPDLIQYQ